MMTAPIFRQAMATPHSMPPPPNNGRQVPVERAHTSWAAELRPTNRPMVTITTANGFSGIADGTDRDLVREERADAEAAEHPGDHRERQGTPGPRRSTR